MYFRSLEPRIGRLEPVCMRRIIFAALGIAVCRLSAAPVKIHGYITSISSPHAFEIDSYHITRDASLQLDLDRTDYPDAVFGDEDLQIGTELDVQGEFNDSTHELHATAIKVVLRSEERRVGKECRS